MVDVSCSPSSLPPTSDGIYLDNLLPDDNVERLRNIRDMFENTNDSDELILQKVEKLQPSDKIKDRFKKFEEGVSQSIEDEYESGDEEAEEVENNNLNSNEAQEITIDDKQNVVASSRTIKSTSKSKKKKDIIAFAEMNNVKTKFENIANDSNLNGSVPKPIRSITPPREGANRVEIENEPMQRSADIVSVYEKVEDTMPETGYIRSRKEIFSSTGSPSDDSSKQPPRIKSITPPRDDIAKRVLKEITPERNDNVTRESDRNDDILPSVGSAKEKAAIFTNGSSRLKSIERSGITIEGELAEKGIAKSRLALFNDPNAVAQQSSTISTTELESEIIKNASGIAKERLSLFKNLEQQQQPGIRSSPSREFKKLKEFTPPPQLDHQQRQYIIIDKESSPSNSNEAELRDANKEFVPETGLAKNRMKQYLETASTSNNSVAQSPNSGSNTSNSVNGETEDLQGKGIAKSLLAKWKSMENVKDKETSPEANGPSKSSGNKVRATSKDRQTSPTSNESSNEDQLPQSGNAKSLLNKWQNIDSNSPANNKERKGPRPITPPPPEELERQKNLNEDEVDSGVKPYNDEELASIGKGHAKNTLAKFESTPLESNINAQFGEEDVIPSPGNAKQLKSKFLSFEKEANKIETSSSKMNYVPKKFTSNSSSNNKENGTAKPNKQKSSNQTTNPASQNNSNNGYSNQLSGDKCCVCEKTVYAMEKIEADKKVYHRLCFKCTSCNCTLNENFVIESNKPYCLQDSKQFTSNSPKAPSSPTKSVKPKEVDTNKKPTNSNQLDANNSLKVDQQKSPKHEPQKSPKHEPLKSPKHEQPVKSPKHEQPVKSPKKEVKSTNLEPKSPLKSK